MTAVNVDFLPSRDDPQGYAPIPAQIFGFAVKIGLDSVRACANLASYFRPSGSKYGNPAGSNRRGLPHLGHGSTPLRNIQAASLSSI